MSHHAPIIEESLPTEAAQVKPTPHATKQKLSKYLPLAISAVALVYALFAGLRTVGDPDLGWQLATGRWILQHRAVPYTDVLSYTSNTSEWIYPVLSQIIFYCTFLLGGYSLISWLSAVACIGTTAVLLRGNTGSKFLTVIAIPLIAFRTAPRAELFTTLLFAIFVNLLWTYHRSKRIPLWLLPLLMLLWVNLHQGYIAGLAMCLAYVFLEVGEALSPMLRAAAFTRLRAASPWLLGTFVATLINPWGIRNYLGTAQLVPVHSTGWIMELAPIHFSSATILQLPGWRNPDSGFWWLVVIVIFAVVAAVAEKRFAAAIILATSIYFPFHSVRLQGPFSTIAVVIAGSVLWDAAVRLWARPLRRRVQPSHVALASVISLSLFAGVRSWDLLTNRSYLLSPVQMSLFGPGVSFWYPEEAAGFVEREGLPKNLFNDYTTGGFVTWRLSPNYPDYIDGRGNGGSALMFRSFELLNGSLDSADWKKESELRDINTTFTSLDMKFGGGLDALRGFCQSKSWRLVYLDAKASIFVRATPQTAALISRFPNGCKDIRFDDPPMGQSFRTKSERFIYYRNSAAILIALGRTEEALKNATLASDILPDSADAHFLRGLALFNNSRLVEAEPELRASVKLEPSDLNSQTLAGLYRQQGRFREAYEILASQIQRSHRKHQLLLLKGMVQIDLGLPQEALSSFNEAESEDPFIADAAGMGTTFRSQLAQCRANAWWKLASLYESRGLQSETIEAQQKAAAFEHLAESPEVPRR
jgi:tetratricopeptide (TPR) repeat protein